MKKIIFNPGQTKVSPQDVENAIKSIEYTKLGKKITVCHLTLVNGHEVTGQSGVVNPENYDPAIGNPIAYSDALNGVWSHLGAILQNELAE